MPDHFKTEEMCNEAVRDDSFSLQFVPDWFVTQQQIIMMMINLMNGTMDIKNAKLKKQK